MSHYGNTLRLTIFGQSHSPAVGMTLEGVPAGITLDLPSLQRFLERRAGGRNPWSTARKETDIPEFISGLQENITCGTPITAILRNEDIRPQDYKSIENCPRPGHADYTAYIKYGPHRDYAGGGAFSGRLTAPLCIAGGICLQLLARQQIEIRARIRSVGHVQDTAPFTCSVAEKAFPAVDDESGRAMQQLIAETAQNGDSVGGVVECMALGVPAGLGGPLFDGMENQISAALFAIPAVKGVEFGAGFAAAQLRGSENNDPFAIQDGKIITTTNHCGGILGGITDGMPLIIRAAIKPTPSIARPQHSVDLTARRETTIQVSGRHDPCIVPRAVPCVEAAVAVALCDALLTAQREKEA